MELKEAIKILKFIAENKTLADSENQAIETVLQALEKLQKENEKLKEIDLTTVHIKGVCDEKERWRNKIKKKIQQIKIEEKTKQKGLGCFDKCLVKLRYESKENVLQELLKEE